jgi:hypothetical protein
MSYKYGRKCYFICPWEKIIQENSLLGLLSVSKPGNYIQVEHRP